MMSSPDREETTVYTAVVNHEEQYAIWSADREIPLGWTGVGKPGTKQEVLAWIEGVWTDMRPLSLRGTMDEPGMGACLIGCPRRACLTKSAPSCDAFIK